MTMTFLSTGLILILATILLGILVITGFIFFLSGFIGLFRKKYSGTKKPAGRMVAGLLMIILPFVAGGFIGMWGFTSSVKELFTPARYTSVPERWKNEWVTDSQAEKQIVHALLTTADQGKQNAFSEQFCDEIRRKSGFEKSVETFFGSYPKGLADCEMKDLIREPPTSFDEAIGVKGATVSFCCDLGGTWYFIYLEYCHRNAEQPEKVGVTEFRVMNLEAAAVFYGVETYDKSFLVCDIRSSDEYNARLIGGRAYLWDNDKEPVVSEDLLRRILEKTNRMDDPIFLLTLGYPGVVIKHPDSTEFGYFYQLKDRDGEPLYAYFQTDSERGNILWAVLCTPYDVDYKHMLVEEK